jgi:hypothetical protein
MLWYIYHSMTMPTRLQIARPDIIKSLKDSGQGVFRKFDLASLLSTNRAFWRLAKSTTTEKFIDFLVSSSELRIATLTTPGRPTHPISRYLRGNVTPYEVALSIRPGSYLSHGTALYIHGLTEQLPKMIYVNREQSAKPQGSALTQAAIDRAFSNKQRQSTYVFSYTDWRVTVLSGKNTNNLEVITASDPHGGQIKVTNIERTLIDIAVRPVYAGGVFEVLRAYKAAEDRMSINVLIATLKKLEYLYPYHQAIGFYMSRAGYEENRTARLKSLGLNWNFYLTHNIKDPEYDPTWKLFYPKGLQ